MASELIRLRTWLNERRDRFPSDADFVRSLSVPCKPGHFSGVVNGKRRAGPDLAAALQDATGIDARYFQHIAIPDVAPAGERGAA